MIRLLVTVALLCALAIQAASSGKQMNKGEQDPHLTEQKSSGSHENVWNWSEKEDDDDSSSSCDDDDDDDSSSCDDDDDDDDDNDDSCDAAKKHDSGTVGKEERTKYQNTGEESCESTQKQSNTFEDLCVPQPLPL